MEVEHCNNVMCVVAWANCCTAREGFVVLGIFVWMLVQSHAEAAVAAAAVGDGVPAVATVGSCFRFDTMGIDYCNWKLSYQMIH